MQRKTVFLTYALILLLSLVVVSFQFIQPVKGITTWIVDDDGPADFHTIQEAIIHAYEGDIIFVRVGTYPGPIVVDKSLTLEGENKHTTIIDGGSNEPSGSIVLVAADNVKIHKFTIQHCRSGGNAIWLDNYVNATISDNILTGNNEGIRILHSSGNIISYNFIEGCYYNTGLGFNWAYNNTIYGNIIENCNVGIGGNYWNNTFFENTIKDNIGGWAGWGISDNFYDCVFFHNNIIDNGHQVINSYPNSLNIWDDGYPSGGNYWSDYTGVDLFSGPYQNEAGSDGIGDTSYVIDASNQDNFPLMEPWTPIPRTIDELKTKVGELGSDDQIDNEGIVRSLISKLDAAQKLIDEGKQDEAKMVLEDFNIQVQELSGIHITPEAADILIKSAEYIISHL